MPIAGSTRPLQSEQTGNTQRDDSSIRLSAVLSALSYALDLTEGQPMGHSVRSCMIGMRIGERIGLSAAERPISITPFC